MTKVIQFQTIHFRDKIKSSENAKAVDREVLLLYALGEDGVIYEMVAGKWLALPIIEENMRKVELEQNKKG